MRARFALTAMSLAAFAAGCGGDAASPGEVDAAVERADFELGGGGSDGLAFEELEPGADVPLVAGFQGGFHIWSGVRLRGVSGTLYLEREARRTSDDKLVLRGSTVVMDVPAEAEESWWLRPEATTNFMCPTPIGIGVYDQELVLRAWLTNEDGGFLAEDELVVVPRCPSGDQLEFCREICNG